MSRRTSATLRAEARILALAGAILLAIGLVCVLILVKRALSHEGGSALDPLLIAGPPLVLGYLSCHFATLRMQRAQVLEQRPHRRRRVRAPRKANAE
jgi:hypothetical protein